MLKIQNITKQYTTGTMTQKALNDISFNLRDNEFVAVLGPSGSGKTTLLNVIGGWDRYDAGDLIINGTSTKKYNDRDWDAYRNHTIGFVFQSYYLIPHQSVLTNVELALTISGVPAGERRKRAKDALERVGLSDHAHKRPNQLSGGQMQRVAIARALINDPDILLADEPTGALDTETSTQVMALLKEVAKDRLVVMVTHNADLADRYATRIIRLVDGKIDGDTNPLPDNAQAELPKHRSMGRASMNFKTALTLSFYNLRTKKARTFLTAFAGSIGIIGIALILSLSTGVNNYITDIQKETMGAYPIAITAQTFDLSSLMGTRTQAMQDRTGLSHELDAVYTNARMVQMASNMLSSTKENNLTAFKAYLDDPNSEAHQYIGENGILYTYDVPFNVYTHDPTGALVDADTVTLVSTIPEMPFSNMAGNMGGLSIGSGAGGGDTFSEMMPGVGGSLVGEPLLANYDLLYGTWPTAYNEVVLVLSGRNEIPIIKLYALGMLNASDYLAMTKALTNGESFAIERPSWSYQEILQQTFTLLPASHRYTERDDSTFAYVAGDERALMSVLDRGIDLTISGIVRPIPDATGVLIAGTIGYTKALTDEIVKSTNASPVILAQQGNPDVNVLSGMRFQPADDQAKIDDLKAYLSNLSAEEKVTMAQTLMKGIGSSSTQLAGMNDTMLTAVFDRAIESADPAMLLSFYGSTVAAGSFKENMTAFGYVNLDAPSSINLYTDSFDAKDNLSAAITRYNDTASDENQITYTDLVGLLLSSVTTIIDVISYVLIAFVSVSLVVSSVMIGIITFISVLERTKEIGILRAIGASKGNIAQVFNAETFIVGLISGLLGVGITAVLLIPINAIIHMVAETNAVSASLPLPAAVILVALSVILTFIAGLIPSRKAANKDPVAALRSE